MNKNQIPNMDSIPEITMQVSKFKLFDKEIFIILDINSQYIPFKKFMDRINNNEDFDNCKLELFQKLVLSRYPDFRGQKNFIRNFLGSHFFDAFDKIEEEYRIINREYKINQITNE